MSIAADLSAQGILILTVLSPIANIIVSTAMLAAVLALVTFLREPSIIIGSLFAYRLFREVISRRILGSMIVLTGIAAISF